MTSESAAKARMRPILPAGALEPVQHRYPFARRRRRLDQDRFAAGAIQLAQRAVEPVLVRVRIARHAQPVIHSLVWPRERQHRHFIVPLGDLAIELMRRHQPRRRARRVMALEPAGMARSSGAFLRYRADDRGDVGAGDAAGPQEHGLCARKIDNGGLDADVARSAFQHAIDVAAQILAHVRRRGRRHPAEAIRRGRGDAAAELRQQLMRHRMSRHAHADVVLAAGDEVLRQRRAPEDQGERTGPELARELARRVRYIACPGESARRAVEVHDDRVLGRTALHGIELRYGGRTGCVGAQAVNRFGGKCDQPAAPKNFHGAPDLVRHSLSGGALRTASVCLRRKSSSFFFMLSSPRASSATANNAALAAPASPMAKVATGMPFGICTVERSESRPCRCFDGIGTPSTGSVACAATTPARCAAPPGGAMIAFMPFLSAFVALPATPGALRWPDTAFASYFTPNSSR